MVLAIVILSMAGSFSLWKVAVSMRADLVVSIVAPLSIVRLLENGTTIGAASRRYL
jgi:hypothetical protein